MTKSVFISSTSRDLLAHRAAVKHVIERLDLRAIDMLNFGSQPGDAVEISLAEVRKADVFVGIVAHRYGYVPDGAEKSVTEQEFDEAQRLKLPCLMYLVDPEHEWPGEFVEDDETAQRKLTAFKNRVNTTLVRSLFTTPENLAQQVSADLAKQLKLIAVAEKRQRRVLLAGLALVILLLVAVVALLISGQGDDGVTQVEREATIRAYATATADALPPEPMLPGFNVVVAGFGLELAAGEDGAPATQLVQDRIADDISYVIFSELADLRINSDIDHIVGLGDKGVEHILELAPKDREQHAAALAARLNADLVIYGVVRQDGFFDVFEPEFYISAGFAAQDPELAGSDALGDPVQYLHESDDAPELGNRIKVMRLFISGLSRYFQGDYATARAAFEQALTIEDPQSLGFVLIFAGNTVGRAASEGEGDLDEALEYYNQALSAQPGYPRALYGRGAMIYQLANEAAGENPPAYDPALTLPRDLRCADVAVPLPEDAQLLALLAVRCYEAGLAAAPDPTVADIDVKTSMGIAQTQIWLTIVLNADLWDEVVERLQAVITIYEEAEANGDVQRIARIRYFAANAHAWSGLHLIQTNGDDQASVQQAVEHYETAVELLKGDINREYNESWIELYQTQIDQLNRWLALQPTPAASTTQ